MALTEALVPVKTTVVPLGLKLAPKMATRVGDEPLCGEKLVTRGATWKAAALVSPDATDEDLQRAGGGAHWHDRLQLTVRDRDKIRRRGTGVVKFNERRAGKSGAENIYDVAGLAEGR